jgi:magnesium transporter
MKRLVGRITIDDIIDVIRDEASGLPASRWYLKVEADDSILELRARLPWLVPHFGRFYL